MRKAKDPQGVLDFQPSTLKITNEYRVRYVAIDEILKATPRILECVHRDVKETLVVENRQRKRECTFTSDNVLRLMICQIVEGASLREIVVRVDESNFLRRFVRVYEGPMMGHTTFCRLKNAVRPSTWRKVVGLLAKHAIENGQVTGDKLRLDTTAYETNIHFPTDSSLLFDVYRVFERSIQAAREIDPTVSADCRLHLKAAKKHQTTIARKAGKNTKTETLKPHYEALVGLVERILEIGMRVVADLQHGIERNAYGVFETAMARSLIEGIVEYHELGVRVVDQTRRRVFEKEKVPNDEKLFSIFEPHTELLKRGKAGKPIEFGHMVLLAQTPEKFISDFDVFERKPVEHQLVDRTLANHQKLFGHLPSTITADKGFYESMDKIHQLENDIDVVAIGKKGKRNVEEAARESSLAFKLGYAFRAGIEGTISFLKRSLRLHHCFNKGWEHYAATVGTTIFVHNLLILARAGG